MQNVDSEEVCPVSKKILHLLDWSSHIDCIVNMYAHYNLDSDYIRCIKRGNRDQESLSHPKVVTMYEDSPEYERFLGSDEYDLIILHGFEWWKSRFVNKFRHPVHVVWSIFGGGNDYLMLLWDEPVFGPETRRMIIQKNGGRSFWFLKSVKSYLGYRYRRWKYGVDKFLRRVEAFCLVLPTEEPILRKLIPHAKCFDFAYTGDFGATSRPVFKPNNSAGCKVWIGQSGALCNNHLDVIKALGQKVAKIDLARILIGYAVNSIIGKQDIQEMADRVGLKVEFIEDTVSYKEFVERVASCSILVMGHYQQAGCGLVSIAMLRGLKVFFPKISPVYRFYKQLGCKVFTIEDDLPKADALQPLCLDDQKWNYDCSGKRELWRIFPEKTKPFLEELRSRSQK